MSFGSLIVILRLTFTILSPAFAFEDDDDTRLEKNKINPKQTFDTVQQKKEMLMLHDSLIEEENPETGVLDYQYYTGQDLHRFAILIHGNHDIRDLTNLLSFEVQFGQRVSGRLWAEFLFAKTYGRWSEMGENPSYSSSNADAEGNELSFRGGNVKQSVTQGGGGLSYRFHFPGHEIDNESLFQTISAYATWNVVLDEYKSLNYRGPGFRADYGFHKRWGTRWYAGLKGAYNRAFVKRHQNFAGEIGAHRRYNLSWLTFALEGGIYF